MDAYLRAVGNCCDLVMKGRVQEALSSVRTAILIHNGNDIGERGVDCVANGLRSMLCSLIPTDVQNSFQEGNEMSSRYDVISEKDFTAMLDDVKEEV